MRPRPVNDCYGHATGDLLIKASGGRLRRVVRRTDTAARLGRDEFTIILEGLRHPTTRLGLPSRRCSAFAGRSCSAAS